MKRPTPAEVAPEHRTLNPERPEFGPGKAPRCARLGDHAMEQGVNRSTPFFRDNRLASRGDVKRVDQDPGIGRKRVLAYHLDRQGMGPCEQACYREIGVLR